MHTHSVHFFDDAYPADEASEFIAAGLLEGDTCIVMLVEPHRRAVEKGLRARGLAVGAERSHPLYQGIDTHDALARLAADGRLDQELATQAVAAMLRPANGSARVRLVGDPAPTLYAAGKPEDAIALEKLVHRLAAEHGAAVFCAYPIWDVCRDGNSNAMVRISAEHTAVNMPKPLWVHGFRRPGGEATLPPDRAAVGRTLS